MTLATFDLTGKVALVTGSSKGMGRAMAEALAEHGARVVISSRKKDQCDEVVTDLTSRFGPEAAVAIACNVGYKDQIKALVEETRSQLGPIDVLIHNAGVNPYYGPMSEISDEAFDKIMATNLRSAHWICQLVSEDMVELGKGSIVVTASVGAFGPSDVLGTYNISKLADIALCRNLALELGPRGVRVNAICPGVIKTDFARALWDSPDAADHASRQIPLRRFGEPDDLKGLAVFLASDASSYITGQAITICGGTHMWC